MRSDTPSYLAVLRTPEAARTFGAALAGRLSYGTVFVALVVALTHATHSYATAGVCMALLAAATSVLAPARAALVDRYGPRRALTPVAVVYALLLVALAAASWRPGTSVQVLGGLSVLAGATAPPLGPTMRAMWGRLLPDRRLLQRAFSLDTIVEELLFVAGPLIAGIFIAAGVPAAAVLLSAVLVFGGTVAFVAVPVVGRVGGVARASSGGRGLSAIAGLTHSLRAVSAPVVVCGAAGLSLGGLGLLVVAFTNRHGQPAAVAWVEAALAIGSAAGGFGYGAVSWRASPRTRLALLAVVLGTVLAAAGLAPSVLVLVAVALVAGLFVAPTLTTAYLMADECAGADRRTQAGSWVNTAFNAGNSGGTAGAGLLVGVLPNAASFAIVGVVLVLAAVACWRLPPGRSV